MARTGLVRAAFSAGKKPPSTPTTAPERMERSRISGVGRNGKVISLPVP